MRVLLVYSRFPYPQKDGGAIAGRQLIDGLVDNEVEVHLLSLNTKKHAVTKVKIQEEFGHLASVGFEDINTKVTFWGALKALLTGKSYNISRFQNDAFGLKVKEALFQQEFDAVIFENLYSSMYVDCVPTNFKGKKILRQHNVEHKIWKALATRSSFLKKWYLNYLAKKLEKYELNVITKMDMLVPITHEDASYFTEHFSGTMYVLPVGVTVPERVRAANNKNLYHIGSMQWMPNREGVEWFLKEVWPGVLNQHPDARFFLAGKGLKPNEYSQFPNVINQGEVEDIEEFLSDKSILIVPIHAGSGVRVKILEALARNKQVVSTTAGAVGLIEPNPVRVSENADEMFYNIGTSFSKGSGNESKDYISKHYNVLVVYNDFVDYLKQIL